MQTRRLRLSLFASTSALLLLAVTPAHGQDDPRKVQAEASFQEAVKLHEKGRSADALDKFRAAYAIYPSPNTLVNMAREEQLLGRKLEALRHFHEALKMPLLNPQSAQVAKQHAADLERQFGRVEVKGPKGLVLVLGDHEYVLPLTEPLDVEPGTVDATGSYGQARYRGRATAPAGQLATLDMVPDGSQGSAAAGGATTTTPVTDPPPASSDEGSSTVRWLVPGGLGVLGLTGIVLGVVFLGKGNTANDDAKALGVDPGCVGVSSATCDRAGQLKSDWNTDKTLSTLSFVGGGVFLAAAAVTAVWWPKAKSSPGLGSVLPLLSPTHAGASASFNF
jgi:hypothetical protein